MSVIVQFHNIGLLRVCTFAVLLGALTACEISYKRGASPSTMASDEQACRAKHSTTPSYQSCMKDRGWFISTADPTPRLAALASKEDKNISVTALKREFRADFADIDPPTTENTQTAKQVNPEQHKEPMAADVESSPTNSPDPNTPSTTAEERQRFVKVSSWWKFGGSAQQLATDQQKCHTAIGENESADPLLISKTMYQCMRKLGWFGI